MLSTPTADSIPNPSGRCHSLRLRLWIYRRAFLAAAVLLVALLIVSVPFVRRYQTLHWLDQLGGASINLVFCRPTALSFWERTYSGWQTSLAEWGEWVTPWDWERAFQPVRWVHFQHGRFSDAEAVERLAVFPELQTLSLDKTEITDATLERLPILTSLESIDLSRTRVTEQGLRALVRQPQLRMINLSHNPHLQRADFEALLELRGLTHISMVYTPIRDEQFVRLAELPKLEWVLNTGCRHITDAARSELRERKPSVSFR